MNALFLVACRSEAGAVMGLGIADSTWPEGVKAGWLDAVRASILTACQNEQGRLVLWSPLLLVCGIWLYFSLDNEPSSLLAWMLGLAGTAALLLRRNSRILPALAIAALGFALAKARTEIVSTPLVTRVMQDTAFSGYLRDITFVSKKRATVTIDVRFAEGLTAGDTPRSLRLSLNQPPQDLQIGALIAGRATLAPLPRPLMPGGFDYGRQLFFDSVGGTGRITSAVEVQDTEVPWRYALRHAFHDLRSAISEKVRAAIPGPLGAFADAIITGERASIPKEMNDSLQRSGLFHVLSISGLHMTLVAGGVFWIVRAIFAGFPALALRHPIKKWAAAAALLVGLTYMLLADSGPATERSYIMIAVMFFAVLVDRRAISLHNLSIAAIIILATAPEQALSASFQMSFMAVMGIAGIFEWWGNRPFELSARRSLLHQGARKFAGVAAASVITSIAAGALSSIPAAHHFGRLAPYGVISNALALPLVGLLIMPMALLGTVLSAIGLEGPPFQLMQLGLAGFMKVSDWVASWQGSGVSIALMTPQRAAGLAFAAALFCLCATRLRWLAIPVAVGVILAAPARPLPDILIDERARNVAVRNTDNLLVPARARQAGTAVRQWLRTEGDQQSAGEAVRRRAWNCTGPVCSTHISGKHLVYIQREAETSFTCTSADIIVAEFPLRRRCKGKTLTIDRFDVWRSGAIAIRLTPAGAKQETAVALQGNRPWVYQPAARLKPQAAGFKSSSRYSSSPSIPAP